MPYLTNLCISSILALLLAPQKDNDFHSDCILLSNKLIIPKPRLMAAEGLPLNKSLIIKKVKAYWSDKNAVTRASLGLIETRFGLILSKP